MAITSILTTLLIMPLVQSLSLTQRTQVAVRSQESARQALEVLTREIQSAIFVYDNTGQSIDFLSGDRYSRRRTRASTWCCRGW